jgi:hypothetical protein
MQPVLIPASKRDLKNDRYSRRFDGMEWQVIISMKVNDGMRACNVGQCRLDQSSLLRI